MKILKNPIFIVLIFVSFLTLGFILRIQILMAVSVAEFAFFSEKNQDMSGSCQPQIVYHRGYSLHDQYPDNSRISIQAAVKDGIKKLEIDVSVEGSDVYVGHFLTHKDFPWNDFLNEYQNKFEILIVDIKDINTFNDEAINELLKAKQHFKDVIYLSRKCDLLNDISNKGGDVSCESMGVFAHQILGWKWWSVKYQILGPRYKQLLTVFPKRILTWTLPSRQDIPSICGISPEIVLIDKH